MRVYVTGASGFIGSHILRRLVERGHEAVALSRDPSRVNAPDGVEVRPLDLMQLDQVMPAIEGCDAGIHAAGVGPSADEKTQQQLNVQASRHLAGTARRKTALHRLVALTSAAVEERGDTLYRRAKIGQEAALRSYGLKLTVLRPTMVIGPWQESKELTRLVERLKGRKTFYVPDGGRMRVQPVHVGDLAEAAVNAVERDDSIGAFVTLAGAAEGITHRDLLAEIRDRTGGRVAIRAMPLAPMRVAAVLGGLVGLGAPIRAQIQYYSDDHLYPNEPAEQAVDHRPRSYSDAFDDAFGPRPNGN